MTIKNWNSDKIVSISAILISLMTLVVSWYQTSIIRQQQRLSVLPYLSLGNQGTGSARYKFMLKNDGIGPAFVEDVYINYRGKKYRMDLPVFLHKHIPEREKLNKISHSNISPGNMIPAGVQIDIFAVQNSQPNANKLITLLKKLRKEGLEMVIIYKSVYEERWKLSSQGRMPEKL